MKKFFIEGHKIVDFEITVFAKNEEEARNKVAYADFSDEEWDSYDEPWEQEWPVRIDYIQEVKQSKQTTLKR